MRFLIHIPQLIYGGAEKVLVDFANYLVSEGHDVEILETYERGLLKNEFSNKIKFNSICSKDFTRKYYVSLEEIKKEKRVSQKIKKIFKKIFITVVGYERLAHLLATKRYRTQKYDVAINYLEIQSPKFCIKNITANKYFQWIHTDISKHEDTSYIDSNIKWYKKVNNIICVSEVSKEAFVNRYSYLENKVDIIYNFYNSENIIKKSIDETLFNNPGINIVSVGRLVHEKGYERAIDIFYRLKRNGYQFNWYIVGDGILRRKLEVKIERLNLQKEVHLVGIKENPYPFIKQSDLFFLPSLYEGFPTVTIEAKILERPVLATEVSGIKEQIVSGETGLIVDNNDEAIYMGLKALIENSELRNNLCKNYNIEKIVNNEFKYDKFLQLIY